MNEDRVEEHTRTIARAISDSMEADIPSIFDSRKWKGRLMEQVMKDDDFKVRLFRFVDVLPSLKSDEKATAMLQEYFSDKENLPLILRQGIRRISRGRVLPSIAGRVVRAGVVSLARDFIAGNDPAHADKAISRLRREGAEFSIDLLGETVLSESEARRHLDRYLELLEFLKGIGAPARQSRGSESLAFPDVSVKVSSFYCQLDPMDWEGSLSSVKSALDPLLKKASKVGTSVTFDMESYYFKDLVIAAFKSIVEGFEGDLNAGVAIQAYLKDSQRDLEEIISWAKTRNRRIAIRLVKGAYWDYEVITNRQKGWPVPVFLNKEETDFNFEKLTAILLQHSDSVYPAIATHNLRSVSRALALAEELKVAPEDFELQVLYGMAEPLRRALIKLKHRVRVYTPMGEFIPGMAYLVRRLLENSSNQSFVRKSYAARLPFDELVSPPMLPKRIESGLRDGSFRNEPPADFSRSSTRNNMRDALSKVKTDLGARLPVVVGGEEIYTENEIVSHNPARPDEIIGRVCSAGKKEADSAISEARRAFLLWKKIAVDERSGLLFRAAQEIRKRRLEIAALEVFETGKTWKDADGDVTEAIDYCEYYGREMKRLGKALSIGEYPGEYNQYIYEPKGVGVVISPWNFPLAIPAGMVSAALVTGNSVIFKPSGLSPVTGWTLFEIFRGAGLPPGVLQFLPGPGSEIGEHLVSHPDIDFVVFTGSRQVGLGILETASKTVAGQKNVKRVISEMGGKNAVIVDETADLDEAVKGVLESALGYQGQKCSACSRVIIVTSLFDGFTARFKEAVESLKSGDPEDPSVLLGPLIDESAVRKTERYIEIAKKEGNTVLLSNLRREGHFVGPSVFKDLPEGSAVLSEEIFGPVISLIRARDIEEALEIANETEYALTGGLYSRSPQNILKVKSSLRAGNIYINRKITGALVGRQPFGGYGMSGIGSKAGGPDYLLQFLNPVSISENTLRKGFAPGAE